MAAKKTKKMLYWTQWIDAKKNPPACGQVVLVTLGYRVGPLVALAYVVKHGGKRRYGLAHTSEYRKEDALQSFPCDDLVKAWMPVPEPYGGKR